MNRVAAEVIAQTAPRATVLVQEWRDQSDESAVCLLEVLRVWIGPKPGLGTAEFQSCRRILERLCPREPANFVNRHRRRDASAALADPAKGATYGIERGPDNDVAFNTMLRITHCEPKFRFERIKPGLQVMQLVEKLHHVAHLQLP